MRILLSGAFNPDFEALPEHVASALRALGHEVRLFDHRAFLLPGRVRARAAWLDRIDRRALNSRFVGAVRRTRPDLVLANQGMVLTRDSIERARALGARCVNWFSDYPAEFEAGLAIASAYDAFYLSSSYAARRHAGAGHERAAWLPFGCDADLEGVPADPPEGAPGARPGGPPVPPVVFVGSHYPEREVLLRFLRGLPVGIWGPGWARAAGDPHLRTMIRGGALRPAAWSSLYRGARVALNIHYGCFGPREVSGDLANTRVFEILACGGACQVVDRQGDVLRLFREGEHLITFASGDELRACVEAALRDDGKSRSTAARGRAAVLARHTYGHRVRVLLGLAPPDFGAAGTERPAALQDVAAAGASR
ncbi:MAG: glycosyltransferase family 1 protein [Acidobacteria bacterium]|nr:glycosyltransferase family 1 protein [Acidobacteriota bacterium]